MSKLPYFPLLALVLPCIGASCAVQESQDCEDGFARDNQDRCLPIAHVRGNNADTGFLAPNTPPTAPATALRPSSPRANGSPLICGIESESVDVDGDSISYTVTWERNGTKTTSGQATQWLDDTVPGSKLVEGDVWSCIVTPNDGIEDGPSTSASVTVGEGFQGWDEQVISLSEANYTIVGEANGRVMGATIAPAGDLDQDGKSDFIVGDYWWENPSAEVNTGKAYVFLGADLAANSYISAADAAWSFEGASGRVENDPDCDPNDIDQRCGGDWVGHAVAGGMDGDGDGVDDLLVCAYRSDAGGYDRGHVGFFSGAHLGQRGTRSMADADVRIFGELEGDRMGHSVNWAGDVDGDGIADLVTGSHLHSPSSDLINAGRTYLMLSGSLERGEDLSMRDAADYIWEGEKPGDESGKRTVFAGDIDGDGMADIATVSLRNQDNGSGDDVMGERRGSGKFYIVLSSDIHATAPGTITKLADVGLAWMGEWGGDALGYGVDSMGDFDGDGLDDISAGSYGNSENGIYSGKSYVITAADMPSLGTRSVAEASYNFIGEGNNDWSGMTVGPAGDMDRDGRSDLVIGSMGHSRPGKEHVGRAYLFYAQNTAPGSHSVREADHIFDGENAWDQAGYRTSRAGDVNGDGMPDLLISAWQGDSPGQSGKLYVMLNP